MKKKLLLLLFCMLLLLPMFPVSVEAREFGEWKTKFGYAAHVGTASYLDDGAILEGFGAAWYSKPVKNQVAVNFQMNKKVEKYSFIIGLINKADVGWTLSGKEAQGIIIMVRSWANGGGTVADVMKITGKGETPVERIASLNSMIPPMNQDHSLSFYKQNGKWVVAFDGGLFAEVDPAGLGFGSEMYVVAGGSYGEDDNYARVKELSMSIHSVLVDDEMSSEYYGDGLMARIKETPIGGWRRVRGYGMNGADNGKGLYIKDGKVVFDGTGGCNYAVRSIKEAVAIDFQLDDFDMSRMYYFSFGLVNKAEAYYNPNGGESEGITVRITSFNNGMGLNVGVWYVSKAGTECLGTIRTTKSSKNYIHNLSFFKEDEKWYVGINGQQKLRVDLDVELEEESFLCAGASTYKELKMSVAKVYIDDEVTSQMKEGTVKESLVSTGVNSTEYGPGGTSFDLQNLREGLRVATENGELENLLLSMAKNLTWYQWTLFGAVIVCLTGSIVLFVRRGKGKKE